MIRQGWELALDDVGADIIGGKGLGLVRMVRLELPVPDFFVLEAREGACE